jgi:type III secretion protein C
MATNNTRRPAARPLLAALALGLGLLLGAVAEASSDTPAAAQGAGNPATTPAAAPPAAAAASAAAPGRAPTRTTARRRATQAQHSSGIAWTSAKFTYEAEGKRLSEVLQDFAATQGLPAVIAEGVEGVVHATFDTHPDAFLNAISRAYGTIWYHDGSALYFYPAKAVQSKLFRLKGYTREQVEQLLTSLNLGDPRYALRFNDHEQTLLANGPPRHIELIGQALESLDTGAQERNNTVVRVFPLRYASASDRTAGNVTVPGLVSVLRGIYGGAPSPSDTKNPLGGNSRLVSKMHAMRANYGSAGRLVPELPQRQDDGSSGGMTGASPAGAAPEAAAAGRGLRSPLTEEDQPWFEADEATNAVVVRGRPQRMPEYEYLIQRLDRRPQLVELEATIIDVNAESVSALGIDWNTRGRHGFTRLSGSPDGAVAGSFVMSTLWTNAGRALLARVEALAAEGNARIIAKPRVLGVANRAAIMSEKRQASVKVAGNLEAQLFTVEAGTNLHVTPQPSEEDGTPRVKLSIWIEDGQFDARTVDGVPVVKRTEIRTEAHVLEGESLLIGGISIESSSNDSRGLPGVSKVPLLGTLFRHDTERKARSERLFLITPKLVRDIDRLPPVEGAVLLQQPPYAPAQPQPYAPQQPYPQQQQQQQPQAQPQTQPQPPGYPQVRIYPPADLLQPKAPPQQPPYTPGTQGRP